MEVLFVQDVPGIGKAGQTKKVADGYARNFLLPRHLAVIATQGAVKQADALRQASIKKEAETKDEAADLAAHLANARLVFRMKAGESGRLFGAITATDIAGALQRDYKITVDRRRIGLEHPIKDLGDHQVPVKVHPEVNAAVTVAVEREAS